MGSQRSWQGLDSSCCRRGRCLFIFLLLALPLSATTYYVDCGGSDSNNGTGTSTAWQTIGKVNQSSFLAGDSVLFKAGCVWREQLTVPSSGAPGKVVTVGAYGTGANPTISGSDVMAEFSNGGSNIWDETSVTTEPQVLIINGALGRKVASRSACGAPGTWFWTANTLSVYATSNPSGTVEAAQRTYAIDTNSKTYLALQDIVVYGANNAGVYLRGDSNSTVTRLVSKWNGYNGFMGRSIDTITLEFCDAAYNGYYGYSFDSANSNITLTNSTASYNARDGFMLDGVVGAMVSG